MQIVMDGISYRLRVRYESMVRSFRIPDGDNAGTMLSGLYKRDLAGTYYDYTMQVEPDPEHPEDYDSFFDAISAPVERHSVTMPYGQGVITFDAMVSEGDDVSLGRVAGRRRWGRLAVKFTAQAPQRKAE